jgi:hypothetical protein
VSEPRRASPPGLPLDEFAALGRFAPPGRHDAYSQQLLRRRLSEFAIRSRRAAATLALWANGEPLECWASLFQIPGLPADLLITFEGVDPDPELWEFVVPPAGLAFDAEGSGTFLGRTFDAKVLDPWARSGEVREEACLVRFALRECYIPRSLQREFDEGSAADPDLPSELFSPRRLWEFVRQEGIVPFQLALLVYTAGTRYRYELDLIHGILLPDPRGGKIPLDMIEARSPRLLHGLDRITARTELPLLARRIFEVLFELKGLTETEACVVLGAAPHLARGSLQTLVTHGYVSWDPHEQMYRALPFSVLTEEEARREMEETAKGPRPPEEPSVRETLESSGDPVEIAENSHDGSVSTDGPPEDSAGGTPATDSPVETTCPLCGRRTLERYGAVVCPDCEEKTREPAPRD